ncbi:interactor of constitutive active ROPs 1-like [Sesamum indicum]|uniref:Interactor of constitutive active ROPs 1-like n=1 Tax=Sesamum indicum TaxID=4182 RepID=A0A6I9TDV8_SESIN|nr:interactor of constitutive active ROPs 1-like [Sesamum indicum]XP_020549909.1 interactor of constitutive active ROPs 1-like [Sesamum indicum]XP_020549910.1 interactor of constitutive active ROPs 1-like [Sesamum indicum]XP_020549911.1 interactor of constitutive active ROPs 1-like [Sesamum indicum]
MPRSRVTEIAHRQSPRGPPNIRASSSDSDPLHVRPRAERSPKLAEGRPARGSQSDPLNQKKLGTRIADLESQLSLAQEELKSLKGQLVPTEAAKRAAQDQHEKKSKKQQKVPELLEIEEKHSTQIGTAILNKKERTTAYETSDDVQQETDVFEVPIEKVTMELKSEPELPADEDELNPKSVSLSSESPAMSEPVNPLSHELSLKNDEINMLKTNLGEKDKELEAFRQENEGLKSQLDEKSVKISSSQSEIDDLKLRLDKAGNELEESRISFVQINEKLEAAEKAKEELENEMKLLRIQTEQWRKAADAAASVLAGGVEMNGKRISQRCGSMDKHYANSFEPLGGYGSYVGSPGLNDDPDDVFGGEKRKGSGIRMLGDLWKKKGQK